ncbi:MAG: potassium transporter TrkG [Candidatus Latescibacterota bacterium]
MSRRHALYLRQRYRMVLSATGLILLLCAATFPIPLLATFAWPEEIRHAPGFLVPAGTLAAVGWGLWRGLRPRAPGVLTLQGGGVIVLLAWVLASLFGAWPFMAIEGMAFHLGVFEAVSGWTTTGLSVVDVEQAPHTLLLWRSVMQWVGGAGLAIVMLAALLGPAGPALAAAEGRGQQLVPQVRQSARLVVLIYAGYVAVGVPPCWLAGMDGFDAVNHAFAALSTGGFSTHAASVGHWDSPVV